MVSTNKLEKSTLEEKIHLKVSDTDEQALQRVMDRYDDMKKARTPQEAEWDYIDRTFKAKPSYKWNGQVCPNLKMEEALIEASI